MVGNREIKPEQLPGALLVKHNVLGTNVAMDDLDRVVQESESLTHLSKDRKHLILTRKGEARNLKEHKKKIAKRNLLERYKKVHFLQRSICILGMD